MYLIKMEQMAQIVIIYTCEDCKADYTCDIKLLGIDLGNIDKCKECFEKMLVGNPEKCDYGGNKQKLCTEKFCLCCYKMSFMSHSKSEFWSEKNDKKPRQVFMSSGKKYIFKCDCGHEFDSTLVNITNGKNWCPYCANKQLCDKDDCDQCISKSFYSHPMKDFWSEKNDNKPRQVFMSSGKKYIFKCDCGHEFDSTLVNITNGKNWCPYCANKQLCDKDDCDQCISKSFYSHPMKDFWSEKNDNKPRQVFMSSGKKYIFKCDCGHEFDSTLANITNGRWCPYCANKQLCDKDDCDQCRDKSFYSHPMKKFWSEKNDNKPRQVFMSSNKKYWFTCENGHIFDATLSHVTNGKNWCPICKNKTESKLHKFLSSLSLEWKHQGRFDWCKSEKNRHLPFDFHNDTIRVIIELDGAQHFTQVRNWNSPEATQVTDKDKLTKAKNNGYSIIRILQEDVWNDKNNWKEKLQEELNKFPYEIPQLIFIGNYPEEYKNFVSENY